MCDVNGGKGIYTWHIFWKVVKFDFKKLQKYKTLMSNILKISLQFRLFFFCSSNAVCVKIPSMWELYVTPRD